jgi:poly(3-hydroxyalkanoate) synthetase
VTGGEQLPWPDDTTTTQTAYKTVFLITGLSPVTVTNTATGEQYVEDGVSGGTITSIDTTSNQTVATIGTLPAGTATFLTGTFRGYGDTGFIEATTAISTQDPATRDLYLLNSQSANSLERVTDNL